MTKFAHVRSSVVLIALLVVCGTDFLLAQQDSSVPVIQTNVRRVILDVVVTGKDGAPARGLTRSDFAVKEDDKPQSLLSFDVHDFDSGPEFVPPKVPPLGANTYLNLPKEPEKGPLYLILYDMWNMDMADQSVARIQLLKFLNNKPEGARFAIIVLSDGMNIVQGFTSDKSALLAALDTKTGKPHVPQIFIYKRNYTGPSLYVFQQLAQYLEGFPGRKNVIWFSDVFPLSLFASGARSSLSDGRSSDEVKELIDTMSRDQISIYPVDVSGASVVDKRGDYLVQDALADATGGHAYHTSNDVSGLLEKATVNGANYYTLTYSPTNGKYDGKLRKISVELDKKGYTLAYRRSYFGVDRDVLPVGMTSTVELAGTRGSIPQEDPLSMEMRHGAPMAHDLIFRAQFHAVGAPVMGTPEQMSRLVEDAGSLRKQLKNKPVKTVKPVLLQSYRVDYRVMDPQTRSYAESGAPTLEFVAAAFDADGNMVSGVLQNTNGESQSAKPATKPAAFFSVHQQFDVPLRAAWIRVAVRDLTTGQVGTLEIPLPLAKVMADSASSGVPGTPGSPASNMSAPQTVADR